MLSDIEYMWWILCNKISCMNNSDADMPFYTWNACNMKKESNLFLNILYNMCIETE